MPSRYPRYLLLAMSLALSGCGPGWEAHRVDDVVPYGNTRTAGTGVAYVRAKMMPEKEIKLEAEKPAAEEAEEKAAPAKEEKLESAEAEFKKKQQK